MKGYIILNHLSNEGKIKHVEKCEIVDELCGSYIIQRPNLPKTPYWYTYVYKYNLEVQSMNNHFLKVELVESNNTGK